MPWPVHPNGLLGAQGDNDTYQISRSLRFNLADSAYLSRTPSASNRKTWTWSGWVKRSSISSAGIQSIFSATAASPSDNTNLFSFGFNTTDTLIIGGGASTILETSQVFRDTSAWYHIVLAFDTTQATLSNRIKLYINGTQVTSFSNASYVTQDFQLAINSAVQHTISSLLPFLTRYFDGYITEVNFIDGTQLTPSSFGETDAITGRWKAKAYSGTYGTNGFYLKFADNSGTTLTTLGKDSSPNGNNWTPNNFSVTAGAGNDSLVDSPSNYGSDTGVGGEARGNYCTLNPLFKSGSVTFANGNLDISGVAQLSNQCVATISQNSNKWYFETTLTSFSGTDPFFGISKEDALSGYPGNSASSYAVYNFSGNTYIQKVNNNSFTNTNTTVAVQGDVIGIAFDLTNGKFWVSKNGNWIDNGNPSTGTNPLFSSISGSFVPSLRVGGNSAGACTLSANFGQRPFAYTAPTGFKALCTTNLPTPIIKKPSSYMDAVAYTGTGASNSISSLGFSPDLVWIKNRGTTTSHALYDTTRGTGAQLSSDSTNAEATSSTGLTSFGSNGFTIGTSTLVNTAGTQYVAWAWDKTPIAGMDIVSFAGNSATQNISHNLGVAPKMVIYKCKNTAVTSWVVGHSSVNSGSSPWNYYMVLNATDGQAASSGAWNNTAPTSTQFTVGGAFTPLTFTYVAYCFAEVEGFSKFGSYTGNGSADGPFVFTGIRPAFVMIKATGAVSGNWVMYDNKRDIDNLNSKKLGANLSVEENESTNLGDDTLGIDFLSNGFKIRQSGPNHNQSSINYIFAAFAESPFKYARAR